jgi:hypothetical protein
MRRAAETVMSDAKRGETVAAPDDPPKNCPKGTGIRIADGHRTT